MGGEEVSGTPCPPEVCSSNFKESLTGEKQMVFLYFNKEKIRKGKKEKRKENGFHQTVKTY